MEVMEFIASILLAEVSEIQHGENIPYPHGKGGWLGIVGELLQEGVGG